MTHEFYQQGLTKIAAQVSSTLGANLLGFYLTGSFVMDAWDERSSDIDFMAITQEPLSGQEISALSALHSSLEQDQVAQKLEGEYIDLASLQNSTYSNLLVANVKQGKFLPASPCEISADNILCLIQFGQVLTGKSVADLGLSVSSEQYCAALHEMLLEDQAEADSSADFDTLYEILINSLRSIYGLESKKLPTKPLAIEYNKARLGAELYSNIQALRAGQIKTFSLNKAKLKEITSYGLSLPCQNQPKC